MRYNAMIKITYSPPQYFAMINSNILFKVREIVMNEKNILTKLSKALILFDQSFKTCRMNSCRTIGSVSR